MELPEIMTRTLLASAWLLLPFAFPVLAQQAPAAAPEASAQGAPAADEAARGKALQQQLARVEDTAQLEQLARGFGARGEHALAALTWQRLVELRPHLGKYRLELAASHAQLAQRSEAYTHLLELQGQGYAFDLGKDQRFAPVSDTEVWDYVLKGFDANAQPFGEGALAWTLPAEDLLLESLAWDPKRKQLLVGSARKGAVYRVGKDGALEPLLRADDTNGMWAVMDIAVDAGRDLLWVASTAIPHFEGYEPESDLGRAGIFKFQLSSGKFLDRYLSPRVMGQSFFMSSLAVGRGGEVYAADGVNNALYVVRGDELKRLFHAPHLSGLRGMAVDGDGDTLYFADSERGIMALDLSSGRPFDLAVPRKLALGGIEGMVWWDGALIIVQGHMQPRRVMRLELAADGRSITSVKPLEANKAPLTAPTDATLAGDRVYLIANSQKANYDRFGLLRNREALQGTRIWSLDAGAFREQAKPAG